MTSSVLAIKGRINALGEHLHSTATLESLTVERTFTQHLPGDPIGASDLRSRTSRPVHDGLWSSVDPSPLADVRVVAVSEPALRLLRLPLSETTQDAFAALHDGRRRLSASVQPWAANYAGHQFGVWAGQLGDGRAISLGEVVVQDQPGPRLSRQQPRLSNRWEVQLKGAGPTPYSRYADGRAVVRSSIRELLASEAMAALGVPTTRALSLAVSTTPVVRERGEAERAAVVLRLAPSWLRFGSFQLPYARQQPQMLRDLANYVLEYHFDGDVWPHDQSSVDRPPSSHQRDKGDYVRLLQTVVERTARLVAHWQAVGFCHGVLNTDNMSILGLTLDYGPFAFLNVYDPAFVCNTSDHEGRYSFQNQPTVGLQNLTWLAMALCGGGLIPDADDVVKVLEGYTPCFVATYTALMLRKLGLPNTQGNVNVEEDLAFVRALLAWMQAAQVDYTFFFRTLSTTPTTPTAAAASAHVLATLEVAPEHHTAWHPWFALYRSRSAAASVSPSEQQRHMLATNPKFVLRNHLAQQAIDLAERHDDYSMVRRLLSVLSNPFEDIGAFDPAADRDWSRPPPRGSRDSLLRCSCSS